MMRVVSGQLTGIVQLTNKFRARSRSFSRFNLIDKTLSRGSRRSFGIRLCFSKIVASATPPSGIASLSPALHINPRPLCISTVGCPALPAFSFILSPCSVTLTPLSAPFGPALSLSLLRRLSPLLGVLITSSRTPQLPPWSPSILPRSARL
jgi:hypothetical protein